MQIPGTATATARATAPNKSGPAPPTLQPSASSFGAHLPLSRPAAAPLGSGTAASYSASADTEDAAIDQVSDTGVTPFQLCFFSRSDVLGDRKMEQSAPRPAKGALMSFEGSPWKFLACARLLFNAEQFYVNPHS